METVCVSKIMRKETKCYLIVTCLAATITNSQHKSSNCMYFHGDILTRCVESYSISKQNKFFLLYDDDDKDLCVDESIFLCIQVLPRTPEKCRHQVP